MYGNFNKRKRQPTFGSQIGARKKKSGYTRSTASALIAAIKRKKMTVYRGAPMAPEIKTVDTQIASIVITATPQFFLLNALQVGTATYNRIGSKTLMKSIQLRMTIEPQGSQFFADVVRILLVYDKSANKALPTFADIIQSKDQAGAPLSLCDDMRNIDTTDRFKILIDEERWLGPITQVLGVSFSGAWGSASEMTIDKYLKLGLPVQYISASASPATIAQVVVGSLYLIMFSQSSTNYTVSGVSRCRYYDH